MHFPYTIPFTAVSWPALYIGRMPPFLVHPSHNCRYLNKQNWKILPWRSHSLLAVGVGFTNHCFGARHKRKECTGWCDITYLKFQPCYVGWYKCRCQQIPPTHDSLVVGLTDGAMTWQWWLNFKQQRVHIFPQLVQSYFLSFIKEESYCRDSLDSEPRGTHDAEWSTHLCRWVNLRSRVGRV